MGATIVKYVHLVKIREFLKLEVNKTQVTFQTYFVQFIEIKKFENNPRENKWKNIFHSEKKNV